MRTAVLLTAALGALAAPIAAQVQSKISILNGDTLVTIERGTKTSCTVTIDDRTLSETAAKPICDAKQRNVVFFREDVADRLVHLEELRDRLRSDVRLAPESLVQLQKRQLDMAKELQARSLALSKEGAALALRSKDFGDMKVFQNFMHTLDADRGFIGVTVDPRPRDTDRHGAYIVAVTPNYPADKAGLRAGDIIVKVDGQELARGSTERSVGPDESLPWIRLSEIVGKLEPGKEVPLEYRRDDRNRSTRITPVEDTRWVVRTAPSVAWADGDRLRVTPPSGVMVFPTVPDAPAAPRFSGAYTFSTDSIRTPFRTYSDGAGFAFTFGGPLAELELVAMNPGLGTTFGTDRGVLIVNAPEKSALGVKAGDVITAVDGRSVETPSELIRVLRTYDAEKSFTLTLYRNKQQQSINTRLGNTTGTERSGSRAVSGTVNRQP